MHEDIETAVNEGRITDAWEMIAAWKEENKEPDDILSILETEVHLQNGNRQAAFSAICEGLKQNYKNYELYFMLGNYHLDSNVNQAYLCMENAEFYCTEEEDRKLIQRRKKELAQAEGFRVKPVSIVLLSYNIKSVCIQCIESIRKNHLPGSYELIVVDNASTDGIYEWLHEQPDIKLIRNEENLGFPRGCNFGIKAAGENDIFLLNNDTCMTANALFCLRMGLYEEENIGAAGCITNYAGNGQSVEKEGYQIKDWLHYAKTCNVPCENPYEVKVRLGGFALLIRHGVIENIGMFDERFSPGYYEDDDLGLRIARAGYRQLLCRNSFIVHYGSASFCDSEKTEQLKRNHQKLCDKWGFDICYYDKARVDLIDLIEEDPEAPIHVLEVGCGCGATLAKIKYLYSNATVKGVELVDAVARVGMSAADIIQGNIEHMELPYPTAYFDYIIFGDVLEHLPYPENVLRRLKPYMKEQAFVLASIPNVMHMSVIVDLLTGRAAYQKSGIMDETHLRFFTGKTAAELFHKNGFALTGMWGSQQKVVWMEEPELVEQILKLSGIADENYFSTYQYLIKARKESERI